MPKILAAVIALAVAYGVAAPANAEMTQAQAVDAMKRLAFLAGSWNCTVNGAQITGARIRITYGFTANGRWLVEQSDVKTAPEWSDVQLWGYDPAQRALVAYDFMQTGVFTKTVYGWDGDTFSSKRNDNGASVSLKQTGPDSMSWIIHPAASTAQTITEDCKR